MMTFIIGLWLALIGLFGFSPTNDILYEDNIQEQQIPTGTPKQSAPPQTIAACVDKINDESCSFTLGSTDFQGVCQPSGAELACTPGLPE